MLTVLAIDKNLMNELDDFESLFENVRKKGNFKMCCWNREGNDLIESIPALFDRHFISENELREWNIIIVSDDRNCSAINPFAGDYMSGRENLPDPEINEVAKMLGIVPTESHSSYTIPDRKRGSIKWNIDVNRELRDEKLKQYNVIDFARPQKIFLVSVVKKSDVDIDKMCRKDPDSRFFDFRIKARYPVNCRFLRFNLSSISNTNTKEDYFRLWMSLLTFVYNNPENIYLAPDALYNFDSVIDKKTLSNQVTAIYSKVHFVKQYAQKRIESILRKREQINSKYYDLPNLNSSISVEFTVNKEGLDIDKKKFGLAKDCPGEDEPAYKFQRDVIEKRIVSFLKAPKRALKQAVREAKQSGRFEPPNEEKIRLNENQTEDLNENIDELELDIYGDSAVDLDYEKKNEEERLQCDEDNYKIMRKRSTVAVIVGGSFAALFALLVGFLPYIINAVNTKNSETVKYSMLISMGSLLLLALAGFITLLILRIPLGVGLKRFQKIIKSLISDTIELSGQYSKFLSKLSTFMKGNSFKTYLERYDNLYKADEEFMLQKNINYSEKIESSCQNWADIFDFRLSYNEKKAEKDFVIDENPEKNPIYFFKLKSGDYKILLNGKESNLITPYKFIASINISMEEDA